MGVDVILGATSPVAPLVHSPMAWALREASGNPLYPFDWRTRYASGQTFPGLWAGQRRPSRAAPLEGLVALRITGPAGAREILPLTGPPDALVLSARVVRALHDATVGTVLGWRFGFRYGEDFVGLVLDAYGRGSLVRGEGGP